VRILLTGGSGFIGAWIVRRLARRGIDVRVFDINSNRSTVAEIAGDVVARALDWRTGDIRATDDVERAARGCDGVIHLAGVLPHAAKPTFTPSPAQRGLSTSTIAPRCSSGPLRRR